MFFETSGWALPKSIAPQKQQETTTKKTKATEEIAATSKEGKVSREADQIQAQLASLASQPIKAEEPKAKKPRNRNKKRTLEDKPEQAMESAEKNKKRKKNNKAEKQQQQPQQKQKQQEPAAVDDKKSQQKKKLQEV